MLGTQILALNSVRTVGFCICILVQSRALCAQQEAPPPPSAAPGTALSTFNTGAGRSLQAVTITISVRDARGLPLEDLTTVRLSSRLRGTTRTLDTRDSADISFGGLLEGLYEVEAECPGYRTIKQQLDVNGGSAFFTAYIYMHAESDPSTQNSPPKGLVLTPKLTKEIDKGLVAMRKRQFESARNHFSKAIQLSPSNPDVYYLRGNSELSLGQTDAARHDLEQAIAIDASHEKALVALGQLQIQAGDAKSAISTLNKSFTANGAGWKTYYLLGAAYAQMKQWNEAEAAVNHSVALAHNQGAVPLLLLGKIQASRGRSDVARLTWQTLIATYPKAPEIAEAKKLLEHPSIDESHAITEAEAGKMSQALDAAVEDVGRPWAPPDVDHKEYAVSAVSCNLDDVLERAMLRVRTQLGNLEKFTATEHIEHQEIDKQGMAGPIQTRQFSYVVFVFPSQKDSVFLEESRDGQANVSAFPTSLATVGLNSLGISVLQPMYRPGFQYQCEGVATVRGEATWQIRFAEKPDSQLGVRRWQKTGTIYYIPIKGRIWLSTATYDILRIETDLREPVQNLELTRDHLSVDYGPVKFAAINDQLWLPWSAEMYLELHGKRYHHRHILSDYLLFGVDTRDKVKTPRNVPGGPVQETEIEAPKPNKE